MILIMCSIGLYLVVFALYLKATQMDQKTNPTKSKGPLHYILCLLFILATFYFAFDFTQQFFTLVLLYIYI